MRSSLVLALLLAGGCHTDHCARNSDCASGEVCSAASVCAIASDAGVGDGGMDATKIGDGPPADAGDAGADAAIDGGP